MIIKSVLLYGTTTLHAYLVESEVIGKTCFTKLEDHVVAYVTETGSGEYRVTNDLTGENTMFKRYQFTEAVDMCETICFELIEGFNVSEEEDNLWENYRLIRSSSERLSLIKKEKQ